jgi:hypothetical protein
MRPVSLPPAPPSADAETRWQWIAACLQEIERASQEDVAQILDSYSVTGTSPATRNLNVVSPTAQALANVFATLIADFQARGVNRTGPT